MSGKTMDTDPGELEMCSTHVAALREAARSVVVELADGDSHDLEIGHVRKRPGIGDMRMLACGGSISGLTLGVRE